MRTAGTSAAEMMVAPLLMIAPDRLVMEAGRIMEGIRAPHLCLSEGARLRA